ncbi:hypothetical protein ADP64_000010 [Achromobacter phage phiAxp-2]|uniref:Uncharacterized protein n=1 Tax=Achromobacter phage phiAxp-2 TaxID=1664246 RepID=A0A0K2FI62_9CAUD|nr:hypothetical protein ADP64_000010 [Achromobacter phage phiAxp-2]ALA45460.1 hypothetical protein ADP64_000010 [Achromobacter phage phiAxp-2]
MNQIQRLEKHTGLGATQTALLLGVAYPTYAQFKSGLRDMKPYHERHIQALLLLPRSRLAQLIGEHVYGN